MNAEDSAVRVAGADPQEGAGELEALRKQFVRYGCGPVKFTGTDDALYERRLAFDHVIDPQEAGPREQFEALSWALRDVLAQQWLKTQQHHARANPKQVYYLSLEFLIGR